MGFHSAFKGLITKWLRAINILFVRCDTCL